MKRVVTDVVGYSVTLTLSAERLTLSQPQVKGAPSISFNANEATLLCAFIERAVRLGISAHPDEDLGQSGAVLRYLSKPQEIICIEAPGNVIELISTSWEPISCELALMLPRMNQQADKALPRQGTVH